MPKNNDSKRGQSVTVYLSNQVVDLVKQQANANDRSVSYIVNKILEEHFKATEKLE